jgi:hypothetical protein
MEYFKLFFMFFVEFWLAHPYIFADLHLQVNCYSILNFSLLNCFLIGYYLISKFIFIVFDLSIGSNSFLKTLYFLDPHSLYRNWMQTMNVRSHQSYLLTSFQLLHLYNSPFQFAIKDFSFFKDCCFVNQLLHFMTFEKMRNAAC